MIPEFKLENQLEAVEVHDSTMTLRLRNWESALQRLPHSWLFDEIHYLSEPLNTAEIAGWTEVGPGEENHSIYFAFYTDDKALLYPSEACECGLGAECEASKATGKQEGTWSEIFIALLELIKKDIGSIPLPPE